jgi:hypothetical protein
MDGDQPATRPGRRATPWILWSVAGGCVIGGTAAVLWCWLPRWAPEWVVRHSPCVAPVLRAAGGTFLTDQGSSQVMTTDFVARVKAWGPAIAPRLATDLVADDAPTRRGAMVACNILIGAGHLHGDAGLASALIRALDDDTPRVRGLAAYCLDNLREPRSIVPLITRLSAEPDADAATLMCVSLGHFRDQRALGVMDRILGGRPMNPGQVSLIVQTLCAVAEFDRELAVPRLIRALGHGHPNARVTAVVLLGRLEEPRALAPLLERLSDPHFTVVQQAVLALVALRDRRVTEPVLTALEATWGHDVQNDTSDLSWEYRVDYRKHVQAIDRLEFTPEQRKRWDALRQR